MDFETTGLTGSLDLLLLMLERRRCPEELRVDGDALDLSPVELLLAGRLRVGVLGVTAGTLFLSLRITVGWR